MTAELLARFRRTFPEDPAGAFREWFHLQEAWRDSGRSEEARALADDLWDLAPSLCFATDREKARFFHNLAVFLGSRGPAADLGRSLAAFEIPLAIWTDEEDPDDVARAHHNRANALQSLGETADHLREAVAGYERALAWRTEERRIARAVTLHNLGGALRRLAGLAPEAAVSHLSRAEAVLREAVAIREAEGLREGLALSLFHLGLTLDASERLSLAEAGAAADAFARSAACYDAIGKDAEAALARSLGGS